MSRPSRCQSCADIPGDPVMLFRPIGKVYLDSLRRMIWGQRKLFHSARKARSV